jgi:hypothetical protein
LDFLSIDPGQEFNAFSERLPNWAGWLATYVVDADGAYIGEDGTSGSLSNAYDLQILMALRSKTDAIVTTGATARAEQYKASRLAPILFITKNPDSLMSLPAFLNPGVNANLVLPHRQKDNVFRQADAYLKSQGHNAFLFEGGAKSLPSLIQEIGEVRLLLDIANQSKPELMKPKEVLDKLLVGKFNTEVLDDFVVGKNRVTSWLITA